MYRAIVWFVKFVINLVITLIPLSRVKKLEKIGDSGNRDRLIEVTTRKWGKNLIEYSNSSVEVIGEENVPKDGGVLFVSNHLSTLDIPIILGYVPREKGFVAKVELQKIPILNIWMKKMGCVFLKRGEGREAVKVISDAIKNLKNGLPMVLFPEGTRSNSGKLGEFKAGSLKLALKSKVPLVPLTLIGTGDIMPKGKFKVYPSKLKVIISKPILEYSEFENDTNKLAEYVRNIISDNLNKYS